MFPLNQLTKIDYKRIINLLLIIVVAIIGDAVVALYIYPSLSLILKCLVDSATHFLIASLSWNYVDNNLKLDSKSQVSSVFVCGLLASFIDLDHFISSRSINLQVATSLSDRPVFHCTTLLAVLAILLFLLSIRIQSIKLHKLSWIILTASFTHHWRDGFRRGIWMCPVGSTPPFSYSVYLFGLIVLPLFLNIGLRFTSQLACKMNIKTDFPPPEFVV